MIPQGAKNVYSLLQIPTLKYSAPVDMTLMKKNDCNEGKGP